MALRSVLGKMGNTVTSSSSKCIHRNGRQVLMANFEVKAFECKPNNDEDDVVPSMIDDIDFRGPMILNRGIDYHMDLGGLGPARFAVDEFNKRKKTQLEFVRLQRTWMKPLYHCECYYRLLLEAVDEAGVVNIYQANVEINKKTEGMCLEKFYIFHDDGYASRLYHYLDNFFVD